MHINWLPKIIQKLWSLAVMHIPSRAAGQQNTNVPDRLSLQSFARFDAPIHNIARLVKNVDYRVQCYVTWLQVVTICIC
jgi:hypothetical protein